MRYADRGSGVKQRIQAMVSQEVYDAVKRAAERNAMTVSAAASRMIEGYIKMAAKKKDGVKRDVQD